MLAAGTYTFKSPLQFSKVLLCIVGGFTAFTCTSFKEVQFKNAQSAIPVTLPGIEILVKALQLMNAASIKVTLLGMFMLVNAVQL